MSNRAERRAAMRAEEKLNKQMRRMEKTQKQQMKQMAGLIRNGITPEDVRKEYERGEMAGFREATLNMTKSCYAAVILVLKDEFGFDDEQCYQALIALDRRMLYSIEHFEMADEVLEKTGLELQLDDPLERVIRKGGTSE